MSPCRSRSLTRIFPKQLVQSLDAMEVVSASHAGVPHFPAQPDRERPGDKSRHCSDCKPRSPQSAPIEFPALRENRKSASPAFCGRVRCRDFSPNCEAPASRCVRQNPLPQCLAEAFQRTAHQLATDREKRLLLVVHSAKLRKFSTPRQPASTARRPP